MAEKIEKPKYGNLNVATRVMSLNQPQTVAHLQVLADRKIIHEAVINGEEWAKIELYKNGITKIYSIGWEADMKDYETWRHIFDEKHYAVGTKPQMSGMKRSDGGFLINGKG